MSEELNKPEWQVIGQLVSSIQIEQRRSRRWGIFFKSLTFVFLFSVLAIIMSGDDVETLSASQDHVAVVDIFGPIMTGAEASSERLLPALADAFAAPNAKAVVLNINSPGGSPVQAGILFDELQLLKQAHPAKPLYAVIGDVGASGAYYIAAVADYIYADKASTVGSIGVIGSGFGFDQLIAKLGVERRTYTAGGNKDFLDPFLPEKAKQKAMFEDLLNQIHLQFISQVELGRGDRLVPHEDLYSGAVWHGQRALELGLIDGLGNLHSVARDQIGVADVLWYSPEKTPLEEVMEELGAQTKTAISWGLNQSLVIH
ncbi:S49 family peptidase [Candidatus Njordibacter sp. Uisw_039]|jgi:protease-4|uniref:S49 family peptidase n=1 Tax=Candidatus Njordibacter sp. Uisw_039 TaxID=3230972 RepID=UPI003D5B0C03